MSTPSSSHFLRGNVFGLLAIVLWSASALAVVYTDLMPAFLTAAISTFVPFLLFVLKWALIDRSLKPALTLGMKDLWLPCLGLGSYFTFYIMAFKHAPALEANLLNYLWPILMICFSGAIFKNHPLGIPEIGGGMLGFVGTYFIFTSKGELDFDNAYMVGYLLATTAAFIWAYYSLVSSRGDDNLNRVGMSLFYISVLCFVLHLGFEPRYTPTTTEYGGAIFLGIIGIAYAFWDRAMKLGNVKLLASLSYFIPLFSTLLLLIKDGFDGSPRIITAMICILGGCFLVNARDAYNRIRRRD